jgi:hypothetical protein
MTWGESDSEKAHLMTEDNITVTSVKEAYIITEITIMNSTAWIIDFSANSHITTNKSYLLIAETSNEKYIHCWIYCAMSNRNWWS